MDPIEDEDRLVTKQGAAVLLDCSTKTIERLRDTGALEELKLPTGGRRYRRADVLALARPVKAS